MECPMGEIHGEPMDAYHANACVSSSKLTTFKKHGPLAYRASYLSHEYRRPRTKALDFGQIFEDALRGQHHGYVVPPDDLKVASNGALSTKEARAWKAEQAEAGRVVITKDEDRTIQEGVKGVNENSAAMDLIKLCENGEQTTLRCPWSGVPGLQARPDWWSSAGCYLSEFEAVAPDLKTTGKPLASFSWRTVTDFGYDRQAAIVRMVARELGYETVKHPLIVVEKQFPFGCQVKWIPEALVDRAERQVLDLLDELGGHFESGHWPRVKDEMVTLEVPDWMVGND